MATTYTAGEEVGINLNAFEAEQIVTGLKKFSLDQVGSLKWFNQHESLETLNIQAHKNSMAQNEEFVSEAFLTFQKVETLIHDLVLIQTWKKLIYPKIEKEIIYENAVSSYFVLYHEATVLNLLQVLMYHPGICKDAGDSILDLLNAIKPKLGSLINWKHEEVKKEQVDMKTLLDQGAQESFDKSIKEMEFAMAMSSLGLFRSITDYIKDLSLSALKNMLIEDDMVCILVYLMQSSPWIRKKGDSMFEKFEGHHWVDVKEEDLVVITSLEAQVWLALMNLLLESEARKTYQYCKRNQSIVLQLKDCITDQTVDQLPPLVDLQRYLEELLIMDPPEVLPSSFGIQPISEIYANITDNVSIDQLAKTQNNMLKSLNDTQRQAVTKKLSKVYNFENFHEVMGDAKCAKCGQAALQRCSRCQQEWYCSRPCQVKAWKQHKSICDIMVKAKDLSV